MTEKELTKSAARRLAIIRHAQEISGNVALTCRLYAPCSKPQRRRKGALLVLVALLLARWTSPPYYMSAVTS